MPSYGSLTILPMMCTPPDCTQMHVKAEVVGETVSSGDYRACHKVDKSCACTTFQTSAIPLISCAHTSLQVQMTPYYLLCKHIACWAACIQLMNL